eukprot:2967866-Amphidinium_carterae.1
MASSGQFLALEDLHLHHTFEGKHPSHCCIPAWTTVTKRTTKNPIKLGTRARIRLLSLQKALEYLLVYYPKPLTFQAGKIFSEKPFCSCRSHVGSKFGPLGLCNHYNYNCEV